MCLLSLCVDLSRCAYDVVFVILGWGDDLAFLLVRFVVFVCLLFCVACVSDCDVVGVFMFVVC